MSTLSDIPFSVLDLAPVRQGGSVPEAFANEIPAQCLATALAAWRAAQTAAGEARRRVIALERRMTVLGSGDFSVIQVLNAEVIAANQALDESLRQIADPAPMTPRGR